MDRKELLELRESLFNEYENRERIGEFDANSRAIKLSLEALVKIADYLIANHHACRPDGKKK